MKTRPWPIVILAFLHIIAPIPNLVMSAQLQGISIFQYMQTFQSNLDIFAFFGFFPVAGVAIYFMKTWSFPVFLSVMGWGFYLNLQSLQAHPEDFPIWMFGLAFIVNTLIVTYFLLPAVRRVYFDSTVRWWERLPRFKVIFGGELHELGGETKARCTVLDVSEGGVFLKSPHQWAPQSKVELKFSALGEEFSIPATVVHVGTANRPGYGVQFTSLNRAQARSLKKLSRQLKKLGTDHNRQASSFPTDFRGWATGLFKGTSGLFPSLYEPRKPAKDDKQEDQKSVA